eukprot:16435006-Heterocapsa_arctica.AAC.1
MVLHFALSEIVSRAMDQIPLLGFTAESFELFCQTPRSGKYLPEFLPSCKAAAAATMHTDISIFRPPVPAVAPRATLGSSFTGSGPPQGSFRSILRVSTMR